jgi:hypothetical protein
LTGTRQARSHSSFFATGVDEVDLGGGPEVPIAGVLIRGATMDIRSLRDAAFISRFFHILILATAIAVGVPPNDCGRMASKRDAAFK